MDKENYSNACFYIVKMHIRQFCKAKDEPLKRVLTTSWWIPLEKCKSYRYLHWEQQICSLWFNIYFVIIIIIMEFWVGLLLLTRDLEGIYSPITVILRAGGGPLSNIILRCRDENGNKVKIDWLGVSETPEEKKEKKKKNKIYVTILVLNAK